MSTTDSSSSDSSPSDFPAKKAKKETRIYKTKEIQYFGRTKRIILQSENGPCPLIAIWNVLLLRNEIHLDPPYEFQVSQETLLALLADKILVLDVNEIENIDSAFEFLPRLADGINVNIKFRRIDDFVDTPQLAIFGLLDIPLYHGWILSREQDSEISTAIGSKSYDDLTVALAGLKPHTEKACSGQNSEECSVDFAAETTTALRNSSPRSSETRSCADSLPAPAEHSRRGKGDIEEELMVLRALERSLDIVTPSPRQSSSGGESMYGADDYLMSEDDSLGNSMGAASGCTSTPGSKISQHSRSDDQFSTPESEKKTDCDVGNNISVGEEVPSTILITSCSRALEHDQLSSLKLGDEKVCDVETEISRKTTAVHVASSDAISAVQPDVDSTKNDSSSEIPLKFEAVTSVNQELGDETVSDVEAEISNKRTALNVTSSGASSTAKSNLESTKTDSSCEIPLQSESVTFVNPDETSVSLGSPAYEGESLPVKSSSARGDTNELTPAQGELIQKFLDSTQLTVTGLSYLQQELEEKKLCVFFRNNHFLTMLKYDNELYQLVTDEGYMTQQDLVWEKLNNVTGDSVFMTGDFKVFMGDNDKSQKWDQQQAITDTADYSSFNSSSLDFDLDREMAMKLQEEEFERDTDTVKRYQNEATSPRPSSLQEVKVVQRGQIMQIKSEIRSTITIHSILMDT